MRRMRLAHRLALCLSLLAPIAGAAVPLMISSEAHAGGAVVTLVKKDIEDNNGWKLQLVIKLPKPPPSRYLSVKFIFHPKVIYETYIDDSGPNEKVRAVNQEGDVQPLVENFDISFGDTSGQLFNQTKFDVVLKRARGFQSADYLFEIKDSDGNSYGKPMNVHFGGKNPVVDRRSMSFSSGSKDSKDSGAANGGGSDSAGNDSSSPPPKEDIPKTEYDTPEEQKKTPKVDFPLEDPDTVKDKPGGCGCEVPSSGEHGALALLASGALFAVTAYRRRRAS